MGEKQIVDIIKSKAKEIEEELVSIRHELHKHPELGVELHETLILLAVSFIRYQNLRYKSTGLVVVESSQYYMEVSRKGKRFF